MLTGYGFEVNNVHIDNTRSRHQDTDYASLAVKIGDRVFPVQSSAMGDVNNGDHNPYLVIYPVPVDDSGVPVTFNFLVVNAGHSNPSDVQKALEDKAKDFADGLLGSGDPWTMLAGGAIRLALLGVDLLTVDCDGWVAGDQMTMTGAQLYDRTAKTPYTETRGYAGSDSPHGCGSNSQYSVTFTVYRYPDWTGPWEVPGGGLTDAGPAATLFKNQIWLFVKGLDDLVYVNRSSDSDSLAWTGWSQVPGGMVTGTGLAVANSDQRLWLFARDRAGNIQLNYLQDDKWRGWEQVAPVRQTDAPVAAAFYPAGFGSAYLYLFCKGVDPDREIYYTSFNTITPPSGPPSRGPAGGPVIGPGPPIHVPGDLIGDAKKFGPWNVLPGGGLTDAGPAAFVSSDTLYVLVKGVGRPSIYFLQNRASVGAGWGTGWTEIIIGRPGDTPSDYIGTNTPAAATYKGDMYLIANNTEQALDIVRFRLPPGYATNRAVVGTGTGLIGYVPTAFKPAVVAQGGNFRIFFAGADQKIYMNSWNGGGRFPGDPI